MANLPIKIVIPARYGSSRLPGKPLLLLCGKPMFWHVAQQAVKAGFSLEDIIIATDDQRILDAAKFCDVPAILTNVEHASGTDRLHEVSQKMNWPPETIVINVQGDEPLIPPKLIEALRDFVISKAQFDIYTVMSPLTSLDDLNNPNVVKVAQGENCSAVYFSRSPIPFHRGEPDSISNKYRHIGIYAYSVASLSKFCFYPESVLEKIEKLEQLRALSNGMSIGVICFNEALPHGIDTEQDYINVKKIMEK
ncbi:3-deoxy-manno-octulosonate cytidylyltransferase [Vibrio tritonius]|uniref:3-deoxy-manno-octulosonate cytidylyltransferase n=1 Tax=Vibrio tritonius TaxID=1435069 RepID=A0ABS7YMD4_9VIBR|nr:3-deoxy-manno-octulosonate cytidylyltransferase [Vibrio tritonius]MCA2016117.1 3-deoxy-manno-octulosonate cytidylyltransferase [Vibrio tritonius]